MWENEQTRGGWWVAAVMAAWLSTMGAVSASTIVRFDTAAGTFELQLFDDLAPGTTANFLDYLASDAYDGTFFHRSVPGVELQGGGFVYDAQAGNTPAIPVNAPIANEFGRSNTRGTIAMAKTPGAPDSATSRFFFNLADNGGTPPNGLDFQDGGATVFGQVLGDGMAVIDQIAALPVVDIDGSAPTFTAVPIFGVPGGLGANLVFVDDVVVLADALTGDLDGDGQLGDGDVLAMAQTLRAGSTPDDWFALAAGDVNLDGVVDLGDLEPFAARMSQAGVDAAALAVPEPGVGLVLGMGAGWACAARRKRDTSRHN